MIRNVVLGRFRPDATEAETAAALAAVDDIARLPFPQRLDSTHGPDAGLKEGGWSFAIVNDWPDAATYREYDLDAEHNRLRGVIGAACSDLARVQFEI